MGFLRLKGNTDRAFRLFIFDIATQTVELITSIEVGDWDLSIGNQSAKAILARNYELNIESPFKTIGFVSPVNFEWYTSEFGTCSVECGIGTHIRIVEAQRNGVECSESLVLKYQAKPNNQQDCEGVLCWSPWKYSYDDQYLWVSIYHKRNGEWYFFIAWDWDEYPPDYDEFGNPGEYEVDDYLYQKGSHVITYEWPNKKYYHYMIRRRLLME